MHIYVLWIMSDILNTELIYMHILGAEEGGHNLSAAKIYYTNGSLKTC